jgi:hypothetical protein
LKEEALDHTKWRNHFGRGFGPVIWQITDDDDDDESLCECALMLCLYVQCLPCFILAIHQLITKNVY